MGCYFPFWAHDFWEDENQDYKSHNFLINAILTDYSHIVKFGTEITFGSNLSSPITLFQYPENTEFSYFMGGDIHLGYEFTIRNMKLIPLIRYSILFPEISIIEFNLMEIRLGSLIKFLKVFSIYTDLGIDIKTEYYNNTLYTILKFIWGLKLLIKL
jgi:hypothetical protein